MKFFWKLFFSIMLVTECFVSIGGFILVNSEFSNALQREIQSAYEENDLVFFSLRQALWSSNAFLASWGVDTAYGEEDISDFVSNEMMIQMAGGMKNLVLCDKTGNVLSGIRKKEFDDKLVKTLGTEKRGYEIMKTENGYYIHCARPIKILDRYFYIENYHDITDVFNNKSERIRTLSVLLLLLFFVGGIVIFLISYWLVRPIHLLVQATHQLADGMNMRPVVVSSQDEIGMLAKDFNRMAEKISDNMEELKDYARRQEMFVANFDHELKTPLTSMIGYADMIRSKRLSEEQTILLANQIVQEGKRLEVMSKKLMQLTVLKQKDFTMRKVSAKYLLTSIYDTVFPSMQEAGIRFLGEIQDDILTVEPDLMKTVCINLLDNARKAIDGSEGEVIFSGKCGKNGYEISVKDNGCGIPANDLPKISEAFYMVDKVRSRGKGGAGLGLAVCMEIVELHGGRMTFESEPGKGTQVKVCLYERIKNR